MYFLDQTNMIDGVSARQNRKKTSKTSLQLMIDFYQKIRKPNPCLGLQDDSQYQFVVIGYPTYQCPYSDKSKRMLDNSEYNDSYKFIRIENKQVYPFKSGISVRQYMSEPKGDFPEPFRVPSFPMVFARVNNDMSQPLYYLNGGSDKLDNFINEHK